MIFWLHWKLARQLFSNVFPPLMREISHAWRDFFLFMWEILHACRESGRNSVQAGDSLSMRESWKPWLKGFFNHKFWFLHYFISKGWTVWIGIKRKLTMGVFLHFLEISVLKMINRIILLYQIYTLKVVGFKFFKESSIFLNLPTIIKFLFLLISP